ncbi:MAG: hypothetical protein US76_04520 [Parcubacteria group bacterium GW2011_GWA2_38_13b]|nr:MAG: hypothetical protein US76_04520 [Parcubacteria group bacterium GW2011_GWA2_38_13b]
MFLILLAIILITVIVYLVATVAIVYHLKKYGVKGDATSKMAWVAIGAAIAFIVSLTILLIGTPWENIS